MSKILFHLKTFHDANVVNDFEMLENKVDKLNGGNRTTQYNLGLLVYSSTQS